MKRLFTVVASLALAILTAHAAAPPDDAVAWKEGWRRGVVTAAGDAAALAQAWSADCPRTARPGSPQAHFATVRIKKDSRPVWFTVALAEGQAVKPKDWMDVNIHDCRSRSSSGTR
jgi:hypothetical protein